MPSALCRDSNHTCKNYNSELVTDSNKHKHSNSLIRNEINYDGKNTKKVALGPLQSVIYYSCKMFDVTGSGTQSY